MTTSAIQDLLTTSHQPLTIPRVGINMTTSAGHDRGKSEGEQANQRKYLVFLMDSNRDRGLLQDARAHATAELGEQLIGIVGNISKARANPAPSRREQETYFFCT